MWKGLSDIVGEVFIMFEDDFRGFGGFGFGEYFVLDV